MTNRPILITFIIILVGLLAYLVAHIWAIVPLQRWAKWTVSALALCCVSAEFVTFSKLMNSMPLGMASFVYNLGNKSLIVALYLLMTFLLLDLGRLVHLVPKTWLHDNGSVSMAITLLMAVIFVCASVHYHSKKRIELTADSHGRVERPLRVVMASDLHIGYHNRRAELARWIDLINAEKPDLIVIAGDIIDYSMRPVNEERMAEEFRRAEAPIYACLGNHEYISGNAEAELFYREAGINLLTDSSVVAKGIAIVGRDDRSNPHRLALKDIPRNGEYFSLLLDHQPYHLEEAEQAGIDFQFSGHTHRGQVWPLSWIVDAMYECAWGTHSRGGTHYYVSSGLGIWGAKFRIGTQSEYVVLTIK